MEARRYRELIVTTPGLCESISGAILYDETIRQQKKDGTPFAKALTDAGIIPGIKVDTGAKDMAGHPGEKITEGLDGLRDRLAEYSQMGARFAKWRAVITVGDGIPSRGCHRGQRACVGSLRGVVPGSWTGPRRLSQRCSWTASIPWSGALRSTEEVLRTVFNRAAQQALYHRARFNRAARRGEYTAATDIPQLATTAA